LLIILQRIPGTLRPTISTAPAILHAFTSKDKNGSALPVPVEGYLEFGFAGAVVLSLILGMGVGIIDRVGLRSRDVGWLLTSISAGTGLIIIFRGSLHQGIAEAAIDAIGFWAAHRILFKRSTTSIGATGSTVEAATEQSPALLSHDEAIA
jgi:hypothetical protein